VGVEERKPDEIGDVLAGVGAGHGAVEQGGGEVGGGDVGEDVGGGGGDEVNYADGPA